MEEKRYWKGMWKVPGFSLSEILIGLGIGAIIITLMIRFLYSGLEANTKLYDKATKSVETDYVFDYIIEELGTADMIQRDGDYIHIVNINPSSKAIEKYHRITYIQEKNRLYRIAGKYKNYPNFSFTHSHTKGKNLLCDKVEDFSISLESPYLVITLHREKEDLRKEIFSLRCSWEDLI